MEYKHYHYVLETPEGTVPYTSINEYHEGIHSKALDHAKKIGGSVQGAKVHCQTFGDQPTDSSLDGVKEDYNECKKCELHSTRGKVVSYRFEPVEADFEVARKLVFLGKCPDEEENIQGLPFVGKTGLHLQACLEETEFKHPAVLLNIAGCMPVDADYNSKPQKMACSHRLWRMLNVIKPKVIIAFGAEAHEVIWPFAMKKLQKHKLYQCSSGVYVGGTTHPNYQIKKLSKGSSDATNAFKLFLSHLNIFLDSVEHLKGKFALDFNYDTPYPLHHIKRCKFK